MLVWKDSRLTNSQVTRESNCKSPKNKEGETKSAALENTTCGLNALKLFMTEFMATKSFHAVLLFSSLAKERIRPGFNLTVSDAFPEDVQSFNK